MTEAEVIEISREAIVVMLKVMGPVLIAGLVVGIAISLFQTITQIQEPALVFIPKMVVVFALTLWLLPFMISTLAGFTQSISSRIVQIGSESDD